MPRDWDARTYDRVADPMTRWGAAVLDRLPLAGDERVLDAGCGSGRVTELLAERLPRGRVVALDGSSSMIEAARERLAPFGDRIEYVVADLGEPIPLDAPVDVVFSTATFHWVPDHDALVANLAAVLRPGGWLVAQCGGIGNIASVQRVLSTIGDGWLGPVHFETPMATVGRLDGAGFVDIECWLTDEPTWFEPGERSRPTFGRSSWAPTWNGCRPTSTPRSSIRSRPGCRSRSSIMSGSTSSPAGQAVETCRARTPRDRLTSRRWATPSGRSAVSNSCTG